MCKTYTSSILRRAPSLVQGSPTECGVPECDREASILRKPWPTRGCCAMGRGKIYPVHKEAAIGLTSPNLYLFHYFLWEYHVWFTPFLSTLAFSGTQLERKSRTNSKLHNNKPVSRLKWMSVVAYWNLKLKWSNDIRILYETFVIIRKRIHHQKRHYPTLLQHAW
jgi:hypothetical protein